MRIISVTGGKGGIGKSLVSANLAVALGEQGFRVVLFDADLQLANLDIMLGLRPKHNLQDVVRGQVSLNDALELGPGNIRVACGGSALQGLMNAGPKRFEVFMSQVHGLALTTDFLIFDTGSGIDQRVMRFLKASHDVFLVSTPDPTSVTDAYATAKVLWKSAPETKVSLVANCVRSADEGRVIFSSLQGICREFLQHELKFMGSVHADLEAMDSVRKRKPVLSVAPMSTAAADFRRLATTVVSQSGLLFGQVA